MLYAVFLSFCLLPLDLHVKEHVATLEVNAFYDEWGRLVFDQMIFRDTDSSIIDWRLLKTCRKVYSNEELAIATEEARQQLLKEWEFKEWPPNTPVPFIPQFVGISGLNEHNKKYVFKDGDLIREVTFDTIVYTHTQYDPELIERDILPKEKRRLLKKK